MTKAATPKIKLENIYKAFGSKAILRGVDLDVGLGESVVIIGGSGTGKSVTLKCILGLLSIDKGSIQVDGQEITTMRASGRGRVNSKFGVLFQGAALFDSLPVWENVSFGLLARRQISRRAARQIAIEKLAMVGMGPDVAGLWPAELSGGMRKRVGLARAIAADPEVIFFDEPTAGLDPITASVINDLIIKVTRQVGATALSITHDMVSARKIADRIAMLHDGKIVWQGPAGQIDSSGNEYVDQFINGRARGPIEMAVRA